MTKLKAVEGGKVDEETGEFKPNGKKSLEDVADEVSAMMPGYIPGSSSQLTLDVGGGKKPTSSELKVKAFSAPVHGQFPKHRTVRLLVDVEVEDIQFPTKRDSDNLIIAEIRRHIAEVRTWERIPDDPREAAQAVYLESGGDDEAILAALAEK